MTWEPENELYSQIENIVALGVRNPGPQGLSSQPKEKCSGTEHANK
jgi:hypothetical protein